VGKKQSRTLTYSTQAQPDSSKWVRNSQELSHTQHKLNQTVLSRKSTIKNSRPLTSSRLQPDTE